MSLIKLSLSLLFICALFHITVQDQHNFGEPWIFNIDAGSVHQYVISGVNPQDDQFLDIIATPLVGDCDLYVSNTVHNPSKDACEQSLGQCRNSTSAHGDIVTLAPGDVVFGEHPIHVGVECLTNAIYSMNAYISDMPNIFFKIENGLPQVAMVHKSRHYARFRFSFESEDEADSFSVSVTPIGNSDPDIYMKWGSDADAGDHTWRSNGFKGEVIRVEKDDPNFKSTGEYHISVMGFTAGMFTLSVVIHGTYSRLMESVPLLHTVKANELRYFKFESRDQKRLMISVSPGTVGGNPDVFVTDAEGVADDKKPGPDNYKWKSTNPTGIDWVTIEDAPAGTYYIAVIGRLDTDFAIVAYPEHNNVVLLDGVAQERSINSSEIQYYKYYHGDVESGIQIQASNLDTTGASGALEVYVSSSNTHPDDTPGKYDFRSISIGKQSNVIIHSRRTEVGTYFIGVKNPFDVNNVPYTIMAASTQSIQTLHNGQVSMWNSVPKNFYRYYMIELPNRGDNDIIVATSVTAGDTDLFVSTEFTKPTKEYCNDHPQHCWRSERFGQDNIVIGSNDPKITTNTFYVAVFGYREHNEFDILVYTSGQSITISEGQSLSGSVQTGKYNYFVLPVTVAGTLRIDLQLNDPDRQDADIYFSRIVEKPNKVSCADEGKCLKSTKFGNDFIETEVTPQTYYIGVHGINAQSNVVGYKLSVSQDNFRITLNAQSMLQHNDKDQIKRFQFFVDRSQTFVEVSSTLISGRTTLYLNPNASEITGPDQALWSSDLWPGNILLIPNTAPGFRSGTWTAAVHSSYDSNYYISASGGNYNWQHTLLTLSRPLLFAAPKDEMMFLRFTVCPSCEQNVPAPTDYYLNIDVMSGSVSVFVKQGFVRPTETDFTWKSEGGQSRNILLSKDVLKTGITYIAVKGVLSDAIFTITASAADSPVYVTNNQIQLINFDTQSESKYFQILNTKQEREVTMIVESCFSNVPPVFFASKTEQHPTSDPSTHDFQSENDGTYRQKMVVTAPASSEAPVTFVGLQSGGPAGLSFVAYRMSAIPVVGKDSITGTLDEHNKLTISVPKATPNPRFPDSVLSYEVFLLDLQVKKEAPPAHNFETVCAIEKGNLDGKIDVSRASNDDDTLQYEMKEVDVQESYMLNVIVRDQRGLKTHYAPRFINAGRVMDKFATSCFGKLANDEDVCNGRGVCSEPNTCECKKDSGFGGEKCDQPLCASIPADQKAVCGGHGKCVAPDQCVCDPGYGGTFCEGSRGFNPAIVLVPLFIGGFCCCLMIFSALMIFVGILGWKKFRGKAYATFEDDEDENMDYLDNSKGGFEEL